VAHVRTMLHPSARIKDMDTDSTCDTCFDSRALGGRFEDHCRRFYASQETCTGLCMLETNVHRSDDSAVLVRGLGLSTKTTSIVPMELIDPALRDHDTRSNTMVGITACPSTGYDTITSPKDRSKDVESYVMALETMLTRDTEDITTDTDRDYSIDCILERWKKDVFLVR